MTYGRSRLLIFLCVFGLVGVVAVLVSSASSNIIVEGSFNSSNINLGEFTDPELKAAYPTTTIAGATKGINEGRAKIVNVEGYGKMLQAFIPKDTITVGKTGVSYQYEIPGEDRSEVWIKQTFKLDPSWPWSKGPQNGGKLGPSLYLGPSRNSGCRPSDGGAAELRSGKAEAGSGGSVRIGWYDSSGGASFYVYHADMGGDPEIQGSQCGSSFRWVRDDTGRVVYATPKNPYPNGTPYNHPINKITTYVMQLRLNTGNDFNGEINVFADGVHVGGVKEIRFRLDGIKWGISQGAQNMFLGGQSMGHEFSRDTYYYSSPQTLYASKPSNLLSTSGDVETPNSPPVVSSKPSEIKNLTASTSANSITVSWSPAANAERYGIRYRILGTENFTTVFTNNTTYTIQNLAPERTYEIGVVSGNTAGFSRWTTITVTVDYDEDKPIDSRPARPIITSLMSTSNAINIYWAPSTNQSKYYVRFKRNLSDTWGKAIATNSNNNFTITGLSSGPLFDVQVIATNKNGASGWSEVQSIRTVAR